MADKILKLQQIICRKQTALCISLDMQTWYLAVQLLENIGKYICMVKLHAELFPDWDNTAYAILLKLSQKYNFMIMQDSKFVDVPKIVEKQIKSQSLAINNWADFITIMPNNYADTITNTNVVPSYTLVATMNTLNSFSRFGPFQGLVRDLCHNTKPTSIVCQQNVYNIFSFTPGVILDDDINTQPTRYRSISQAIINDGNNVVIIGDALLGDLANYTDPDSITIDIMMKFILRVNKAAKQSWSAFNTKFPNIVALTPNF